MNLFLKILKWFCVILNCLIFLALITFWKISTVIYTSINEILNPNNKISFSVLLILVIPTIIYFLLNFAFYKFKNKKMKILSAICIFITAVFSTILYICFSAGFLLLGAMFAPCPVTHTINEYDFISKDIRSRAKRTNNLFPTSYPLKVDSDLRYYIYENDDTFICSLYFKTTKNYIDDVINKQKNNIIKTITWKDIEEYNDSFFFKCFFDFQKIGTFYLLENKTNSNDIAIIGITKDNEILFFYADKYYNNIAKEDHNE